MSALLGSLLPYLTGAVVLLFGVWRMWAGAKKAGRNEQLVKEGKAREQDIQNIKKAADAGSRVRPDDGGMLDDPHDLDRS